MSSSSELSSTSLSMRILEGTLDLDLKGVVEDLAARVVLEGVRGEGLGAIIFKR